MMMMMFVEDGRGAGEGIVRRCETVLAELTNPGAVCA